MRFVSRETCGRPRPEQVAVSWFKSKGGVAMNDALLAGQVDFAGDGPPPFTVLCVRTRGSAVEVKGVAAMSAALMYLLARNPNVKTVRDFGPEDRTAVPGAKDVGPGGSSADGRRPGVRRRSCAPAPRAQSSCRRSRQCVRGGSLDAVAGCLIKQAASRMDMR